MNASAVKRESWQPPFSTTATARPHLVKAPRGHSLGKGVIAGMIGGLIGTVMMSQFQSASEAVKSACQGEQRGGREKEDATMKAAGKLAELAGRKLSFEQRKKLGPVVHYAFGTLQGGLYGAAMELTKVDGGMLPGILFGSAVFGLMDEYAVPALGLSGKAGEYPVSTHAFALASHLVYGFSTEIARRGLRAAI